MGRQEQAKQRCHLRWCLSFSVIPEGISARVFPHAEQGIELSHVHTRQSLATCHSGEVRVINLLGPSSSLNMGKAAPIILGQSSEESQRCGLFVIKNWGHLGREPTVSSDLLYLLRTHSFVHFLHSPDYNIIKLEISESLSVNLSSY